MVQQLSILMEGKSGGLMEHYRSDGPAIEEHRHKFWYFEGRLHREDGPAVENSDGTKEWCIYGRNCNTDIH
jgi:hypothetical protein